MWRLGKRSLPSGLVWDGGSDWIALSNDFASYLTFANNSLLRGLLKVYEYTLLPAESFFHTVLVNSEHCDTIVDNNLHATNWKRRLGCKCQYKNIVDWCGCSPNDFKLEDWSRLQLTTEKEGLYFARKFEPVIDLLVINKLESWIQDDVVNYKLHGDESWDKYWENIYDRQDNQKIDESKLIAYDSMTRLVMDYLITLCKIASVDEHIQSDVYGISSEVLNVSLLMENNRFRGLLVHFNYQLGNRMLTMESYIRQRPKFRLIRRLGPINRLVTMTVCSDFDVKELFFRNYGCILGPMSTVSLLHEWSVSEDVMDDELMNFSVSFSWIDPNNKTVLLYEESVGFESPDTTSSSSLVLQSIPNMKTPMKPGTWKVVMVFHDFVVAETSFLITPVPLFNYEASNLIKRPLPIESDQEPVLDSQESQILSFPEVAKEENALEDKSAAVNTHSIDSLSKSRFKKDDHHLIDSLISSFWSVQEVCLLPDEVSQDSRQHNNHEYSLLHHPHRQENDPNGNEQLKTAKQSSKNTSEFSSSNSNNNDDDDLLEKQEEEESSRRRQKSDWICPEGREGTSKGNLLSLKSCSQTAWSSFSPDPKSEII